MIQILNPWKSTAAKLEYYNIEEKRLIAKSGDYAAYHQFENSVIYTYKNIAINNLVKFNKLHFDRLADERFPEGNYTATHFLYNIAMQSKKDGIALLRYADG